jgi:hypothetical protein
LKKIFKLYRILVVVSMIVVSSTGTNAVAQPDMGAAVTYQTFYDNLSPYGTWIDYPGYGHVWSPELDGDFRPYDTNGHWVYTDEGWAWSSDFSWGWAPFHYGSWLYDDMYGWLWIPAYTWSPAWVTWGYVDNYYCWAPLMPGVDVTHPFGSWRPHSFYWNAVSREHIYDRNLAAASIPGQNFSTNLGRITFINNFSTSHAHNFYYSKGPDVQEVQKYVAPIILPASIKEVHNFKEVNHEGNVMNVYRPPVQDPHETIQQHPNQVMQPGQYRRVDNAAASRPIIREEQRPMMQRSEQRTNLNNLPVFHANNGGNGGGQRHDRK